MVIRSIKIRPNSKERNWLLYKNESSSHEAFSISFCSTEPEKSCNFKHTSMADTKEKSTQIPASPNSQQLSGLWRGDCSIWMMIIMPLRRDQGSGEDVYAAFAEEDLSHFTVDVFVRIALDWFLDHRRSHNFENDCEKKGVIMRLYSHFRERLYASYITHI